MTHSSCELLLLRHGIAEERSPERPDAGRPLTESGRRRTRAVLERVAALELRADRLLSSPLTRALQTAELAVSAGLANHLEVAEALAPGADPLPLLQAWLAAVGSPRPLQRLLLVGHEPDLGLLACRLLGAEPGAITLKKAGLALLDLPEPAAAARSGGGGGASLRLLLSPRFLVS